MDKFTAGLLLQAQPRKIMNSKHLIEQARKDRAAFSWLSTRKVCQQFSAYYATLGYF